MRTWRFLRRTAPCLVLFLLAVSFARAEGLSGAQLRLLPNGLRLIVREQRATPLVAIDVWVRAGSRRERPEENGAAHFLEHMLFKGTATRKPGEIDAAIEDLGALLNAGTTRDGSRFYTTVPAEHTGAAMEVVADALRNAALDPAEVERERAVILDELARAANDTRKTLVNALYADHFAGAPLGRPVLGTPQAIRALSRDALADYFRRWYTPDHTTVVVVGSITAAEAEALVRKHFGEWRKPSALVGLPEAASVTRSDPGDRPAPEARTSYAFGFPLPPPTDERSRLLAEIVAAMLADPAGPLNAALAPANEPPAPAPRPGARPLTPPRPAAAPLAADAETELFADGGLLAIHAVFEGNRRGAFLNALAEAVRRLREGAFTEADLAHVKRRLLGSFLFEAETFEGQARLLGEADARGDFQWAVRTPDAVRAITRKDVIEFAARALEPARMAEARLPLAGK
jgi:zinc protease